ncbi:ABC transporter permease [Candidatus Babeliales bacterium]|nr:ABC transporter permease [Candidatus Babeliales bacterium]MBP9843819.1 ABC transporter permease [Candidatus Babeliales bacterium]
MFEEFKKLIKSQTYFFLATPALIWLGAFLILPIIFVIILSLSTGQGSQLVHSFSLDNFRDILQLSHVSIVIRSISLASFTAVISLIAAYPVAYFLALHVKRFKFLFLFLLSVPFLINVLVQVYAWFFILEKNGLFNQLLTFLGLVKKPVNFLNSYFAIYLVMFHVYLPFMIMPIYSALEKIDVKLVEASYDLGASFYKTLWHIILPLSMPGVRAGFFLVYVVSFGEYVIPSLLGGMKLFFVGTLLSEYFFIGKDWHLGAAFICLSCGMLFLTAIMYNWIFNKITMQSKIIR